MIHRITDEEFQEREAENFRQIIKESEEVDVMRRAMAAYFRFGGVTIPSGASKIEVVANKRYCVLRICPDYRVIYRIRNDGMLKFMRRPPACIV